MVSACSETRATVYFGERTFLAERIERVIFTTRAEAQTWADAHNASIMPDGVRHLRERLRRYLDDT